MTDIDPSIADEWNARAKAAAGHRRAMMVPVLVGLALFFVITFASFSVLGRYFGENAIDHQRQLQEQGVVEATYRRGRQVTEGEQARSAGLALFLAAFALGAGAGFGAFRLLGGKISAEHSRGLRELGR